MAGMLRNLVSTEKLTEFYQDLKDEFLELSGKAIHSTTEFFSDFLSEGKSVQSANISRSKLVQDQVVVANKEKEQKDENLERSAELAQEELDDQQDKQLDKMRSLNGFQYTDRDLEEALDEILENPNEFQSKNNLTDEETDQAMEHVLLMKLMSPDERDQYLRDLAETNPKVANAIARTAKDIGELEAKSNLKVTAEEEASHDDFFDLDEDTADQVISHAETMENLSPEDRIGYLENLGEYAPEIAGTIAKEAETQTPVGHGVSFSGSQSAIGSEFTSEAAGIGENTQSFPPYQSPANDLLAGGEDISITQSAESNSALQQVSVDRFPSLDV